MTEDTKDAAPRYAIDAANVIHAAGARHALSHLEGEFLAYWDGMATFSRTEAKKLLAWLATKYAPTPESPPTINPTRKEPT